jgi:hypothetical protein
MSVSIHKIRGTNLRVLHGGGHLVGRRVAPDGANTWSRWRSFQSLELALHVGPDLVRFVFSSMASGYCPPSCSVSKVIQAIEFSPGPVTVDKSPYDQQSAPAAG